MPSPITFITRANARDHFQDPLPDFVFENLDKARQLLGTFGSSLLIRVRVAISSPNSPGVTSALCRVHEPCLIKYPNTFCYGLNLVPIAWIANPTFAFTISADGSSVYIKTPRTDHSIGIHVPALVRTYLFNSILISGGAASLFGTHNMGLLPTEISPEWFHLSASPVMRGRSNWGDFDTWLRQVKFSLIVPHNHRKAVDQYNRIAKTFNFVAAAAEASCKMWKECNFE